MPELVPAVRLNELVNALADRVAPELVSIDDIIARNYNLDIKNPHVGEKVNHDPEKLLKEYTVQQNEIQLLRDQLKNILSDALSSKGADA